jgi:hypothetical protein
MRVALIAAVMAIALMPQASGAVQEPAAAQAGPKVKITFEEGGFVTLESNGANVREILAEWSRQGGSTFVNSERLVGTPLTLQFTHQPEKDVMASLLRQASGYVLGPRRAGTIGASRFEVVYILPTSNPSAGGYTPAPAMPYQQPQYSTVGAPDDEIPPAGRGVPPPPPAGAPGAAPPGPQPAPQPAPGYTPATAAGSGVAVPVIAIPPVTSGQPTPTPTPTPTPSPAGRGGNPGTAGS